MNKKEMDKLVEEAKEQGRQEERENILIYFGRWARNTHNGTMKSISIFKWHEITKGKHNNYEYPFLNARKEGIRHAFDEVEKIASFRESKLNKELNTIQIFTDEWKALRRRMEG